MTLLKNLFVTERYFREQKESSNFGCAASALRIAFSLRQWSLPPRKGGTAGPVFRANNSCLA
jgi:hypothetical protein